MEVQGGEDEPPAGGADDGMAAKPIREQGQQQGCKQDAHLRTQQFEMDEAGGANLEEVFFRATGAEEGGADPGASR